MIKFIFFLLLGTVGLVSCGSKPYYNKTYSFENKEWDQRNKPQFTVDIKDTSVLYDFYITIRTTTDYPNSNLWIFLNSKTPNKLKAREPFQLRIANADGTWIGNKTGTIVENQLYFKRRKFPTIGKYTFTIEQAITEQVVTDVLDIGLTISVAE